jgi:hypothetical protein
MMKDFQVIFAVARVLGWIIGVIWAAVSVVRPDPAEHLRWYDRLIRAIGVLILGTFILFGIPIWFGWTK